MYGTKMDTISAASINCGVLSLSLKNWLDFKSLNGKSLKVRDFQKKISIIYKMIAKSTVKIS